MCDFISTKKKILAVDFKATSSFIFTNYLFFIKFKIFLKKKVSLFFNPLFCWRKKCSLNSKNTSTNRQFIRNSWNLIFNLLSFNSMIEFHPNVQLIHLHDKKNSQFKILKNRCRWESLSHILWILIKERDEEKARREKNQFFGHTHKFSDNAHHFLWKPHEKSQFIEYFFWLNR